MIYSMELKTVLHIEEHNDSIYISVKCEGEEVELNEHQYEKFLTIAWNNLSSLKKGEL